MMQTDTISPSPGTKLLQVYELTTLYGKGYEGWISEEGAGDNEFRDAYQEILPC